MNINYEESAWRSWLTFHEDGRFCNASPGHERYEITAYRNNDNKIVISKSSKIHFYEKKRIRDLLTCGRLPYANNTRL